MFSNCSQIAWPLVCRAQVDIRALDVTDEDAPVNNVSDFSDSLTNQHNTILTNKNVPSTFDSQKHFVFLYGFRVDAEGARAWHAETFKRLYHSGSNAMYTGFSWRSDEGLIASGALNYWGNVEHAFNTAPIVTNIINTSINGTITIAAHSLGNMVIGEAIQNEGFTPANYFMLNPAVPTEAYSQDQLAPEVEFEGNLRNPMIIPDWDKFYNANELGSERRLFASDWHRLFTATDDQRKNLAWQDVFNNVASSTNLMQFYSNGEEVLARATGDESTAWNTLNDGIGRNAWITQEHQKGKTSIASGFGSQGGGWGFNCQNDVWWVPDILCTSNESQEPAIAFAIDDNTLRERPFFKPFDNEDLFSTEGNNASDAAEQFKHQLLAHSIPALSHAAGVEQLSDNIVQDGMAIDMNAEDFKKDWPAERDNDDDNDWRHSDAKDVAYRYVFNLYDQWVLEGGLK